MIFSGNRFQYTINFTVVGVVLILLNILFDIDLFERFVVFVHRHEELDIDELTLVIIPLIIGLFSDMAHEKERKALQIEKERKALQIEKERLMVLKATMSTVHDINNNFLNNTQLFVHEAQETGRLSHESIKNLNDMIFATADELKALGNVQHTTEKEIATGIRGIDYKSHADQ